MAFSPYRVSWDITCLSHQQRRGVPLNYGLAATEDNLAYTLSVATPKLENGNFVIFKMPVAPSGGSSTLNVNSLGAKKMLKASDQATQIGASDLLLQLVFDP
ncbi:MAG: hypothetical protein AB2L14_34995 [Candidatus Xenobiia bacterium LiM19]